ncbi:IS3 family transposase [Staphylococcus saprophyticus]
MQNYIIFYNDERIKSKLKGLSPKNFRKQTFEILH